MEDMRDGSSSSGSFVASTDHCCGFFNRSFLTPGSVWSSLSEKLGCIKHFMQERFCQNFHHRSFQEETWNLQLLTCRAPLIWGAEEHQGSGLAHSMQTFDQFPLVCPRSARFPVCAAIPKHSQLSELCCVTLYLPAAGQAGLCAGVLWLPRALSTGKGTPCFRTPTHSTANLMCSTWSRNSWDLIGREVQNSFAQQFRFYYVTWINPTIFFPSFLIIWLF